MSDGLSEGQRAGAEATGRAKRMAAFGKDLCYTCGRILEGGIFEIGFDRDTFLQAELVIEGGRPVPAPKKVSFCSVVCGAHHAGAMHLVSRMVDILAREKRSPAFRENFRRHMEKVLRTTEKPNV